MRSKHNLLYPELWTIDQSASELVWILTGNEEVVCMYTLEQWCNNIDTIKAVVKMHNETVHRLRRR